MVYIVVNYGVRYGIFEELKFIRCDIYVVL